MRAAANQVLRQNLDVIAHPKFKVLNLMPSQAFFFYFFYGIQKKMKSVLNLSCNSLFFPIVMSSWLKWLL